MLVFTIEQSCELLMVLDRLEMNDASVKVAPSCFSYEEAFGAFCPIRRSIYFMSFKHFFTPFSILMPKISRCFIISGAIRTTEFFYSSEEWNLYSPQTISVGIGFGNSNKIPIINSLCANKHQSHNLHGIHSANLRDSKFGLEFILIKSTKQILAQGYYCSPNSLLFNLI